MSEIMAICIVGIIMSGIYGLFELFVRRNERIKIIEKADTNIDLSSVADSLNGYSPFSFSALKFASLMIGMGGGLLASIAFKFCLLPRHFTMGHKDEGILLGALVLVGGGLGLLLASFKEHAMNKSKKKE